MDQLRIDRGFDFKANPARIIFGSGTIQRLPDVLQQLELTKPLILCTVHQTAQAKQLETVLDGRTAGIFTEATMHTPVEVTEKAMRVAEKTKCDCIVAIGGGSTVGLGKALSFRTGLHHIAIPTTYAGSEVTPILGETQGGRKTTRSDPKILPQTVIYDVELTLTLPLGLTATSGINAIAHAVEALYARNGNPMIDLFARQGVKALAEALPELMNAVADRQRTARSKALYGAWLCGTCLGSVGMALHHKLCHTLGGSFNLPHAETHTVILPHALAYNAPKVPETMRALGEALPDGDGDAIQGLNVLLDKLGVKRDLESFGLRREDIAKAAEIAVSNPYWNPRDIEKSAVQELIRRAWAGEAARADQ